MKKYNLLALLMVASHLLAAQPDAFNIMSYNLRLPVVQDGINYWPNRKEMVVSMMRFYQADLLGVQEAFRSQLDDITKMLPEYTWWGVCRTDGTTTPDPDNEFSAIIYRKDRFERLDGGTFWLSENPERVGEKGWDAALPRIVTWASFHDLKTGKQFYHFNTHFDHIGEKAREQSALLILERIKTIAGDKPVVLTGDFNCNETTTPYRNIVNENDPRHLTDAITITELPHHGPVATWTNGFQFPGVPGGRIDYVFVKNGFKVHQHAILSDCWSGRFPSDHLPVWARIYL